MAKRLAVGITTALLFTAFAFPTPLPPASIDIITDIRRISTILIFRMLLGLVPAFLGLRGVPVPAKAMGWKRPAGRDYLTAAALAVGTLGLGLLFPSDGLVDTAARVGTAVWILLAILVVVSAAAEEIFFRSWLLRALPFLGAGPGLSAVLSVALFALVHAGAGWPPVVFAAVAGILYTSAFLTRECIWTVLAAHAVHNALAFAWHAVR